ncbi:hypothetical protein [Marivita geojedonensis]|uniref:hypothetical protein n=1 Tax=Marivita geojedonensis TaxID=1123756 RepID=UPI001B80C7C7|nr:hypothetical protein [Marivita geojedonensis]
MALVGTIVGAVLIFAGVTSGSREIAFSGVAIMIGGWVSSAGLGTLAEISIKLSKLGGDDQ